MRSTLISRPEGRRLTAPARHQEARWWALGSRARECRPASENESGPIRVKKGPVAQGTADGGGAMSSSRTMTEFHWTSWPLSWTGWLCLFRNIGPEPNLFLCLNPHSVALGFEMSNARAVRYRRLALAEEDKAKADLLLKLADECDRGILCTAEWRSARPSCKKDQPPRDTRVRLEWAPYNNQR